MKENQFDDTKLESPGQVQMSRLVGGLPEDSLSLAWRSQMNEKLMVAAKATQRKKRLGWVLKPAFGLACASALAVLVTFRTDPMPTSFHSTGALEAAIVQKHVDNVEYSDMVGAGLNPMESKPTAGYVTSSSDWSEVDLDSL